MVQAEKQRRLKWLGKKQQREIIANYFVSESDPFSKTKSKTQCQIDDNEARAVQQLVLDLMEHSEVMNEWMRLLIVTSMGGHRLRWLENNVRSQMRVVT